MEPRRINLADPDFEPTDEELCELSRRAFAHVPQQNAEATARMTQRIEELRQATLTLVEALLRGSKSSR